MKIEYHDCIGEIWNQRKDIDVWLMYYVKFEKIKLNVDFDILFSVKQGVILKSKIKNTKAINFTEILSNCETRFFENNFLENFPTIEAFNSVRLRILFYNNTIAKDNFSILHLTITKLFDVTRMILLNSKI